MPKMISGMTRLTVGKMSLDLPIPAIAEKTGLNIVTVRSILGDDEIKEFVAELKDSRKQGFLQAERQGSAEYADGVDVSPPVAEEEEEEKCS